ncbi:holo-ACP synthase [Candidatus Sumerlaeota bacterium]|nr:holo-ACP synthase [Candidatus Sumerlaeota bacterium]
MITGTGIDVVEIARFRKGLARYGERFRNRFFTTSEIAYCESRRDPALHFAVRFAAKEAVAKALGRGIAAGVGWRDIEVVREESGRPSILLHGIAREQVGTATIWLSMSHSETTASAMVVLESP